jgi:intracellular sulfur oxidation DsrE/DsrF family protein
MVAQEDVPKVTFVLHGPVIRDLLRENYGASRQAVDLAASLTALQVVEIKVCETWLGKHGLDAQQLQPFVETVSFAPGELRRLQLEKNYLDF